MLSFPQEPTGISRIGVTVRCSGGFDFGFFGADGFIAKDLWKFFKKKWDMTILITIAITVATPLIVLFDN